LNATAECNSFKLTTSLFCIYLSVLKLLRQSIINHYRPCDAVRKQKKNISEDVFSSELSRFKKKPSGNLKFDNLGIFQSLKLPHLMGENPSKSHLG